MGKGVKMKKIFYAIAFLSIIFASVIIDANPIAIYYQINELSFDTSGWKIEIHTNSFELDSLSLSGWFLTSLTDTSYIKSGKFFNMEGYLVLTDTDFVNGLKLNEKGDKISLFNSDTLMLDSLIFGDIPNSVIVSPKPGQSICKGFIPAPFSGIPFYYLDSSPTFGQMNDTLGAKGNVEGFVKDTNGNPLKNVTVLYSYIRDYSYLIDSSFVLTDSSGYFRFNNYAKISTIYFLKENHEDSGLVLQIWPDSTISIEDIKLVMGVIEKIPVNIIKDFNLSQNFPNPFNNSTSFFYTLPKGDNVEITIYDGKGAVVQKLFSGYQSAGKYRVNWKAENLASGVYIYHIRTGSFKISKKAVLLK